MVKAESVATVASIAEQFRTSQAAVVTEYRGLTMKQLTALRRALGPTTEYAVAKNTFAKRAAADAGVTGLDDLLSGPTGIAFVKGEPSEAAKAIREFAKTNPLLVIKGGVLDGRALPASDVAKLADLESREVLLAKFAGALKGNLAKAAGMLTQLPAQFARLAAALAEQKAAGAPAEQAAPTEETAESAAPEAAAATVVAADVASTEPEAAETPAAEEAPAVEAAADQAPADTTPTDSDSEPEADTTPTNDDGVVNTEVQQAAAAADEAPADQA